MTAKAAPDGYTLVLGYTSVFAIAPAISGNLSYSVLRDFAPVASNRSALLPDVPTVDESGLRGFEVIAWVGVLAPAKTPNAILRRLNEEIARVMNTSDMRSFVIAQGAEPGFMDGARFGAYIKAEIAKWGKLAKAVNFKSN